MSITLSYRSADREKRLCRLAFSMLRGVNPVTGSVILQRVHSECDFFNAPERQLQIIMETKSPLFDREYRDKLLSAAENEAVYNDTHSIREYYFTDDDYPHLLRQCCDAPMMLYGIGECDFNNRHIVSIVGTRHATAYGIGFVNRLVEELADKVGGSERPGIRNRHRGPQSGHDCRTAYDWGRGSWPEHDISVESPQ